MVAHEEVLEAAQFIVNRTGKNEFTIMDIISEMAKSGTEYKESTIRTHVASRLCDNCPPNHGTTYAFFERIEHGKYRLIKK
jgi:hypothetical protein